MLLKWIQIKIIWLTNFRFYLNEFAWFAYFFGYLKYWPSVVVDGIVVVGCFVVISPADVRIGTNACAVVVTGGGSAVVIASSVSFTFNYESK